MGVMATLVSNKFDQAVHCIHVQPLMIIKIILPLIMTNFRARSTFHGSSLAARSLNLLKVLS